MPLFYFDVHARGKLAMDEKGADVADLNEARVAALALLPDIAADALPQDELGTVAVIVRNGQREAILRASLRLQVEYYLEKGP